MMIEVRSLRFFVGAMSWGAVSLALGVAGAEPTYTVAVDPGHGGSNLGAATLSPPLHEKHVTLDIARRLQRQLGRDKGVRVVLCRNKDVMVPLRTRVRCGNDAQADLFLSLHANASPEGPKRGTQRGFELYVLPMADVDVDAALAAAGAPDDASAVWAAHSVRASVALAVDAGRRVAWRLGDALGVDRDRGIKQQGASLDVLQGLRVPGLLVEVGFLDHPEEGQLLVSEAGREKIALALALAIGDLRARKARGQTDPAITAAPAR
jgi:N-acetylmuramoyl-L-alanine amidase